jgi:hypothetical protein
VPTIYLRLSTLPLHDEEEEMIAEQREWIRKDRKSFVLYDVELRKEIRRVSADIRASRVVGKSRTAADTNIEAPPKT